MAATSFRVVRIRSCTQCGEVLAKKCGKCQAHPDRKPRITMLYDYPAPLKVAECGCCILLSCQRTGCSATFWRSVKERSKEKKSTFKTFFCSSRCSMITQNIAKTTRVKVKCEWGPCSKVFEAAPNRLAGRRFVFCKPVCWQLFQAKQIHEKKQVAQALVAAESKTGMVACYSSRCRGEIQPHREERGNGYTCTVCGNSRRVTARSLDKSEEMVAGRRAP